MLGMLREVVLDTETTGVDALNGDRIVEIGCVELLNHVPSGRIWHAYLNPERPMSEGAFAVHGLSDAFLGDKPLFTAVAEDFWAFVDGARLIIHNAAFDVGFLNAELTRAGRATLRFDRVLDTLGLARRKHPGAPASLDALCARYGIDNTRRTRHGALLDAEILAEVYIELIGGRQGDLGFGAIRLRRGEGEAATVALIRPTPLAPRLSEVERLEHAAFIAGLGASALWRDYIAAE